MGLIPKPDVLIRIGSTLGPDIAREVDKSANLT